jgi:uridine kinase
MIILPWRSHDVSAVSSQAMWNFQPYDLQSMLKSPLSGSEKLLEALQKELGPNRKPLLIAIDGADGVGKSSLASWLAWQLGMPALHLDLYLIKDSNPLGWRAGELDLLIRSRVDIGRPIIVEGILILDALDQISRRPDFLVYVRGNGSQKLSSRIENYRRRQKPEELAKACLDGFGGVTLASLI